jgi:Co/Zn/Cd efflux system component
LKRSSLVIAIIGTIIINIVVLLNGEAINKWFNSESADRVIIVVIGAGGLAVPFIQGWYDKREKKHDEVKNALEGHKRDIVEKFEQTRGLNTFVYGLLESIDQFSYKKELLQHIYTRHGDVF